MTMLRDAAGNPATFPVISRIPGPDRLPSLPGKGKGSPMGTYAAELYMPGVTPEQLLDTARRAKAASAEMTAEGTRLTYLSATPLSGDDTCYCLFQGTSEQAVRQANDRAGIPYERVIPAVHLAAEDLP
jgi:hypothetical protein